MPFGYLLRLALRALARSRAITFLAMLTLGGGITAAVALLGVFDSGTRPLPVPAGGDIVALEVRDGQARRTQPDAAVAEWALAHGIEDAGAVQQLQATLTHPDYDARRVSGAAMHVSVLRLLQVQPALGRLPTAEDEGTLVLGWSLYEEIAAGAGVLGEVIAVDGVPHTVIGVMPPRFGFPENESFWTVLPADARGEVVARLVPGTPREQAAAAVAARLDALAAERATGTGPHRVEAKSWTTSRDGGADETVIFAGLSLLVLLLLLVCCANVGTLLLVRGTERASLLAVQGALGATRAQLTLQLFLESAVIAFGGGIIGLAGGAFMLRMMELRLSSHWGYYWMSMEVRPIVLVGTVGVVLLAALAAGTLPSLRASRVNLASLLASQGRGQADPRQRRLGRWFVGGQVALSSLCLIAAVFLAVEFGEIGRTTERLPLEQVAVARLTLPDGAYQDAGSRTDLVLRLREELLRIPGADRVSVTNDAPGGRGRSARLLLPGADPELEAPRVMWVGADENMPAVYNMPVISGRPLRDADASGVLVTRGVAERHFGGDAVGQRLRLDGVHDGWLDVIGVVEDWFPDQRGTAPERVIVPLVHASSRDLYVSVGTSGGAAAAVPHVRGAVRAVDERLPVEDLATLGDRMAWFLRMMKVIAGFGMLGGAASAAVAAVGLYGVMAYQVRARRREIGIRMAVGAGARRVLMEVIRESVLRVAPGVVVGVGFALTSVPALATWRGIPIDQTGLERLTQVGLLAGALLLLVGVLAGLAPALRAAGLDPQEVLRAD